MLPDLQPLLNSRILNSPRVPCPAAPYVKLILRQNPVQLQRAHVLLAQSSSNPPVDSTSCKKTVAASGSAETLNWEAIIANHKLLLMTARTLNELLEYWESSDVDWHIERGLGGEYRQRGDFIAMSSRYQETVWGCENGFKGSLMFVGTKNSPLNIGYHRESHIFDTKDDGWGWAFNS